MRSANDHGFTLIEVLIAATLLAGAVGTLLHVATRAIYQSARAEQRHIALTLAQSKLEQLLALPFRFDGSGQRVDHPDLAADAYADALDRFGLPLGPGDRGAYARSWSISREGDDTLQLAVCVTTSGSAPACVWATRVRMP